MDYDKEFYDDNRNFQIYNDFENDIIKHWYTKGAKRAEELLLADKNIIDLRRIFDNAPDWVESVQISYNDERNSFAFCILPRPKPAWEPSVGEAVFCLTGGSPSVVIGSVLGRETKNITLIKRFDYPDGLPFNINDIKPFSPENIGKRWEEL